MDTVFIKTHMEVLISPIPSAWKTAIITPVFKSGDHMVISNYRPISILPAVSKIAEKWISDNITFECHILLIASYAIWISKISFY